ncbi:hypothetical protein FF098_011430 [Parvularcula flava]|nr:hypothetical protein [Aquisalinus luteolus]NHK28519.1 hypothetical protein [Aquisalinus luteolus]
MIRIFRGGLALVLAFAGLAGTAISTGTAWAQDWSEDLAMFRTEFFEVDNSYSAEERARAEALLAELEANADGMSEPAFVLALAEIVAVADNGHTVLRNTYWQSRYPRLAVRFMIADDGLFIADGQGDYEALAGQRVTAVEGLGLSELRDHFAPYHPGLEGHRDEYIYAFLESPDILNAAGIAERSDTISVTLLNGETVRVGNSDAWPPLAGIWQIIPQARAITFYKAGLVDGDPLYLQEPDELLRYVPMPERDAVYIQFRANIDFSGQMDMRQAATDALTRLQEDAPAYVILDQRFNTGGDLNTTRDLMQAIPEIVGESGHVFAITSARTFSAGISSVGYLKQAGGDRVTIIGAPVGDPLEFWAEGDVIFLPQSGANIGISTERHNYMTGCPEDDCHGSIQRHPIAVDSLAPDYRPVFTYDDFIAGRDPYLEAALSLMP